MNYCSSKIMILKTSKTGIVNTINTGPKNDPINTTAPSIIKGFILMHLLIISGLIIFDSISWVTTIIISVKIAFFWLIDRANITAGTPPIYGPINGIMFVKAQMLAKRTDLSSPISINKTDVIKNKHTVSITNPFK